MNKQAFLMGYQLEKQGKKKKKEKEKKQVKQKSESKQKPEPEPESEYIPHLIPGQSLSGTGMGGPGRGRMLEGYDECALTDEERAYLYYAGLGGLRRNRQIRSRPRYVRPRGYNIEDLLLEMGY